MSPVWYDRNRCQPILESGSYLESLSAKKRWVFDFTGFVEFEGVCTFTLMIC